MFKFFAIALLVTLSHAAFKDTKTIFTEIDQDRFGNTMLSAIQLNLASKAPLDDIVVLIDQIVSEIEVKQDAIDKANVTNQADCDSTISGLTSQIAETTLVIEQLEKSIVENEELLKQAKVNLAQAINDYDETVKQIEIGTAERKAAHERWANEDYEQTIQITTLDEGVKLINHMLHGVAFSQIESRYEKVVDKLKNSKGMHAGLFKPLVTSLTQLATKLNYDNVMNILKLLGDIRASIVQAQNEAREAEEKAQADWEAALKILEAEKKALAAKKARLTAFIAATEKLLGELRKSLENNKVTLENLKTSLKEKQDQCAAWSAEYLATSTEINRELEILGKLREHIVEKNAQAADYLKGRAAGAPA